MISILGACCGPCFGASFQARQISATAGWYGSFAFAGGASTTLWLVETNTTTYYDLTAAYGAAFPAASCTTVTTINAFTGDTTVSTVYSPGGDDTTAFNARAAAESAFVLNQVTLANTATEFINNYQEPPDATNANLLHYQTSDVFTSPNAQTDVLARCHALIDSYITSSPACFSALDWDTALELSYDAGGSAQSEVAASSFPFPSAMISALNVAANDILDGPAEAGDAVTLEIGQVLSTFNTWSFFADQAGDPPAACSYNCVPAGSGAALSTYLLPSAPGDTVVIADPDRNMPSPCDASSPPTC